MEDVTRALREALRDLETLAQGNGMRLSTAVIREALEGSGVKDDQLNLVYSYLDKQGIDVYDPDLEDGGAASEETSSKRPLEQYLAMLDEIGELEPMEEKLWFDRAGRGDEQARRILIERYLQTVCDLAGEFETRDGQLPSFFEPDDLVQEANTALVMAVSTIKEQETLAAYRVNLLNEVTRLLTESLDEAIEEQRTDDRIVNRLNKLARTADELEEELGHRPSLEELSAYLDLPSQDLADLLALGGQKTII